MGCTGYLQASGIVSTSSPLSGWWVGGGGEEEPPDAENEKVQTPEENMFLS